MASKSDHYTYDFLPMLFAITSTALYAALATGVVNLELAPARFLFQKV
jgi:hypothetical protein